MNRVRRYLREDSQLDLTTDYTREREMKKKLKRKKLKLSDRLKSMDFNVIWNSVTGTNCVWNKVWKY